MGISIEDFFLAHAKTETVASRIFCDKICI